MNTKKPKPMSPGSPDNFQTPPEALHALIPFMNPKWVVWECACGKGYLVSNLIKSGYKVKWSDIERDPTENFLTMRPRKCDIIITNPPFSLKNEFIVRCYEIGIPFALLLPLTALESKPRQAQWRKGLQLIILDKRLHFETPNNMPSHSWFATAWFTNWLRLPKDINFMEV